MSVYPVRLSEWFNENDENHENMKAVISCKNCLYCKKKRMHWHEAWAHHSLPWGYGDAWCRQKCYINYQKKNRRKNRKTYE